LTSGDHAELRALLKCDDLENVSEFVSTGSTVLDYAISNQRDGGVPVGRITELIGENQAGKTLLATHILASTQKKGGVAVCIDTECDMDMGFSQRVGLDWERLYYINNLECIEDIFAHIERLIVETRQKYKDTLITIVWDSIAASKARAEIENPLMETPIALHARLMSAGLRKIRSMIKKERIVLVCTNQTRTKIGVSFGDPMTTSHGKAMSFYTSVRVKLARTKKIEDKTRVIGAMCQAKVIKNKVGPAWRTVDFPVMYDYGVDDAAGILEYLCDVGAIESGAWRKILGPDGTEHKFRAKDFRQLLLDNPLLFKHVLDKMEEHAVIQFNSRPDEFKLNLDSILEAEAALLSLENADG
jgi:recombination protein RecA